MALDSSSEDQSWKQRPAPDFRLGLRDHTRESCKHGKREKGKLIPTRILLVDDHQMMRQELRSLLEVHADLLVVGEAGDGLAALQAVRDLRPEIVIMDIGMPGLNGIEATRQITREFPEVRVIGLSMLFLESYEAGMTEAGATVLLSKELAFENLVAAIRHVMRGGSSPRLPFSTN